jgi:hypothetical protein
VRVSVKSAGVLVGQVIMKLETYFSNYSLNRSLGKAKGPFPDWKRAFFAEKEGFEPPEV